MPGVQAARRLFVICCRPLPRCPPRPRRFYICLGDLGVLGGCSSSSASATSAASAVLHLPLPRRPPRPRRLSFPPRPPQRLPRSPSPLARPTAACYTTTAPTTTPPCGGRTNGAGHVLTHALHALHPAHLRQPQPPGQRHLPPLRRPPAQRPRPDRPDAYLL